MRLLVLVALFFVDNASAQNRAQAASPTEYQIKAAFLFNFAKFVDWPAKPRRGAEAPLTFCTLGVDPFRGALDESVNGKTIGSRPLRVQHFKESQDFQGCEILFLGEGEKKQIKLVLEKLNKIPTLTVGESEQFLQQGGMINFLMEGNKIRFEINLDAAQRAGLKISARLLSLAKTVVDSPGG